MLKESDEGYGDIELLRQPREIPAEIVGGTSGHIEDQPLRDCPAQTKAALRGCFFMDGGGRADAKHPGGLQES